MARCAEGDPLRGHGRIGRLLIIGGDEPGNVDQPGGIGGLSGERTYLHFTIRVRPFSGLPAQPGASGRARLPSRPRRRVVRIRFDPHHPRLRWGHRAPDARLSWAAIPGLPRGAIRSESLADPTPRHPSILASPVRSLPGTPREAGRPAIQGQFARACVHPVAGDGSDPDGVVADDALAERVFIHGIG